jgi:hypothetical protein
MLLFQRIAYILLRPKSEWTLIALEATTITTLYLRYIIPLVAIEPLAIKLRIVEFFLNNPSTEKFPDLFFMFNFDLTTPGLIIGYGLHLVEIYLLAVLVNAMAPLFSGSKNQIQAMKVVAYASTASWTGKVFLAVPIFSLDSSVVFISNVYTVYLLYLGLPVLMNIPASKTMTFTAITAGCFLATSVFHNLFFKKVIPEMIVLWRNRFFIDQQVQVLLFIFCVLIIVAFIVYTTRSRKSF